MGAEEIIYARAHWMCDHFSYHVVKNTSSAAQDPVCFTNGFACINCSAARHRWLKQRDSSRCNSSPDTLRPPSLPGIC